MLEELDKDWKFWGMQKNIPNQILQVFIALKLLLQKKKKNTLKRIDSYLLENLWAFIKVHHGKKELIRKALRVSPRVSNKLKLISSMSGKIRKIFYSAYI